MIEHGAEHCQDAGAQNQGNHQKSQWELRNAFQVASSFWYSSSNSRISGMSKISPGASAISDQSVSSMCGVWLVDSCSIRGSWVNCRSPVTLLKLPAPQQESLHFRDTIHASHMYRSTTTLHQWYRDRHTLLHLESDSHSCCCQDEVAHLHHE